MTRDEAAAIITSALASAGHIEGTLSADAFAKRLAASLDALGLLDHCAMSIAPPVPGEPFARADPQSLLDRQDRENRAKQQRTLQEGSADQPPWSAQRQRT